MFGNLTTAGNRSRNTGKSAMLRKAEAYNRVLSGALKQYATASESGKRINLRTALAMAFAWSEGNWEIGSDYSFSVREGDSNLRNKWNDMPIDTKRVMMRNALDDIQNIIETGNLPEWAGVKLTCWNDPNDDRVQCDPKKQTDTVNIVEFVEPDADEFVAFLRHHMVDEITEEMINEPA